MEDNRCQLCLQAVGTLAHRHACTATAPPEGWPPPAPKASLVLGKVSETRKTILLRDSALLAVRLLSMSFDQHGQFRWLMPVASDDQRLDDVVWYCDGSMLNGRRKAVKATGFGIAVVSKHGDLLAYGLGRPPSWCSTAAAAEVWAVQVILTLCPPER